MTTRTLLIAWLSIAACSKEGSDGGGKTGSAALPTPAPPGMPPSAPVAPPISPVQDPGFGDIAFKTFASGRQRIAFTSDTAARATWNAMSGAPATGTYVKQGKEIAIEWNPKATNYGSRTEKFRQLGPCSFARYLRVDLKGSNHDDPMIYQQVTPRCDTVRIAP